jgi:cell division protein FtsI (penicillin-binding protein 3)
MAVKKEILLRVGVVYVAFLLLALVIISRILYIQFVQGASYRAKAKEISLKDFTIEPARGDILATDGRILSTSIPFYEIRMDMRAKGLEKSVFFNNVDSLALCLSKLFGDRPKSMYKSDLIEAYRQGLRYYLLKRRADFNQLKAMKTFPLFRLGKNKSGMIAMQENVRFQPHHSLASRTIGYISKSEEGNMVGIEGSYDQYLKGIKGVRLMQRLSGGVWMPVNDDNEVEPQDGYDVVSTIDVNIQDVAEAALRQQLTLHDAHHGCAILMEVKTGEIKAIANLQKDEFGNYREIYNYAIGEATEPGSTFKLASLIAALEDGYVNLDDTIATGNGEYTFSGKKMKDSGEKGHGNISVKQVFELSSNVGVSRIIAQHYKGKEKQFVDRLYSLKLNQKLGLDLNGEAAPSIKYPGDKTWSGISLPWMSIGYEVKLAPIHTLTLYNAIANDGKMVKPHFVKEVLYHGSVEKSFDTEVILSSICSRSTLKKVRDMLEGVVEEGTATNLKNNVYKIAGKTGTAQIAKSKYGYKTPDGVSYQASFVGYFPADRPMYSCIVVVNAPSNGVFYGNAVAGPVFRAIADRIYASSLNIHPITKPGKNPIDAPFAKSAPKKDLDYVLKKLDVDYDDSAVEDLEWISPSRKENKVSYTARTVKSYLVPNVIDMGLRDAMYLLENAGLKVIVKGRGKVTGQSIPPGSRIVRGATIVLDMSLS